MTVKEIQEVLERIQSVSMKDTRTVPATAPMSVQDLAEAFDLWESDGFQFTHLGMNPEDYCYLRKFCRDAVDFGAEDTLFKMGVMGTIWGVTIIVTKTVQPGVVWLVNMGG